MRDTPPKTLQIVASHYASTPITRRLSADGFYVAGPAHPRPDYAAVDANPVNQWAMGIYRQALVENLGRDSPLPGWGGVLDLTHQIVDRNQRPTEAQETGVDVCRSIFPHWIGPLFTLMVAWPFGAAGARVNTFGVHLTCQWLLGDTEIVDAIVDGGRIGRGHGLLIKRCRYLEESGCSSVCINMCKIPTQTYFKQFLGLDLCMEPNYDDFSCQATFGKTPLPLEEDPVYSVPCLNTCASRRRALHAAPGGGCHLVAGGADQSGTPGARFNRPMDAGDGSARSPDLARGWVPY